MSIATEKLYANNKFNQKRLFTDSFFTDEGAENHFKGVLDRTFSFVEKEQLLDRELWSRFAEQFNIKSDSQDRGWRGEFWGKMMRGAAFVYSYTGNEELYSAMRETVEAILSSEDEFGRISTYEISPEQGFSEFDGWDIWSRKYVLLGLEYFLEICSDEPLRERIIASLCRQVDYMISKLGRENGKLRITLATRNWRGLNSSSLLEPVIRLYMLTGEKKYLDFSDYIISEGGTSIFNIFEAALEDTTDPYQYPVTKAYEMMSCFEGALEYYRATGVEKYKTAVINFARRIINSDVTIIGCCGTHVECFDHSRALQTDSSNLGLMQETCVTVTWMKFCYQLLSLTGDPAFADCIEQSLYNAYLGSLNTEKVKSPKGVPAEAKLECMPFDSYAPLLGGTRGNEIGGLRSMLGGHYYGCCACIASAGIGIIPKMASMLTGSGIALNMYIPGSISTSTPKGKVLGLTLDTEYPVSGEISIKLSLEDDEEFDIMLRIPSWSEKTELCINGVDIDASIGYTAVRRKWKNGDVISLSLDMRGKLLRPISNPRDLIITDVVWGSDYIVPRIVIASNDAEYRLAIRKGPLVLARDARCGEDILEKLDIIPDSEDHIYLEPSDDARFSKLAEYKAITASGKKITLVDYASAGKTWDESSKYVCWLPTKSKYSI